MTLHTKQYTRLHNVEFGSDKMYPIASTDSFDENDEAQEKRREERRKRKQIKRRDKSSKIEEGDPDVLLQEPKKQKRQKNKKVPNNLNFFVNEE